MGDSISMNQVPCFFLWPLDVHRMAGSNLPLSEVVVKTSEDPDPQIYIFPKDMTCGGRENKNNMSAVLFFS